MRKLWAYTGTEASFICGKTEGLGLFSLEKGKFRGILVNFYECRHVILDIYNVLMDI